MRQVTLGKDVRTSALGFGCASLGSRISRRDGLIALGHAFERGVTYFDVAPPYGRGEAEEILGSFVADKRDRVKICTKVGLTPPKTPVPMRLIVPALQRMVGLFQPLRKALRRSARSKNIALPLTPELLRTSLTQSLARLGVEQVAVFALHNARPEVLAREEIVRALEDILASGKAELIAVSGDYEAAKAAVAHGAPYGVAQFALDPLADVDGLISQARTVGISCIGHSVLGVGGNAERLLRAIGTRPELLHNAGYEGTTRTAIAGLLVDWALAINPDGVVLLSMFSREHLEHNIARATKAPRPEAATWVRRLIDM